MLRVESFGIIPFRRDETGRYKVLLILHHQGNHWGFPKGKANVNEKPLESAARELKEETGLHIERVLSDTAIQEQYQFRYRGEKMIKVVHYFPALVDGELKLQVEEVRDAKWLDLDEAQHYLTFQEARAILKTCLSFLEES